MTSIDKKYLIIEEAKQIQHRLQPLGVNGFYFICIPWGGYNPKDPSSKTKGLKLLHPKELNTKIVSDTNIWTFSEHYMSQIAKYDLTYWHGHPDNTPGQIQLWPQSQVDSSKRHQLIALMEKHHFRSRLSYFSWVHNHDNWHAGIFLTSTLKEEEVAARIEQHGKVLTAELAMTVDHLYRKYLKIINPFNNYRVLSAPCIQVLEHLSNGLKTEMIARQMGISEAGVNYHINKARKVLGGQNRTHMISLAHRLGII